MQWPFWLYSINTSQTSQQQHSLGFVLSVCVWFRLLIVQAIQNQLDPISLAKVCLRAPSQTPTLAGECSLCSVSPMTKVPFGYGLFLCEHALKVKDTLNQTEPHQDTMRFALMRLHCKFGSCTIQRTAWICKIHCCCWTTCMLRGTSAGNHRTFMLLPSHYQSWPVGRFWSRSLLLLLYFARHLFAVSVYRIVREHCKHNDHSRDATRDWLT